MPNQIIDATRLKYIDGNIFVKPTFGTEVRVGIIKENKLTVKDKDNYHKASDSLGIDKEVLYSKLLRYTQIEFKFHGYVYSTTRKYFTIYSKKQSLMNGRNMLFMHIPEIRLDKALKYDKWLSDAHNYRYSIPRELRKMDIFDVFEYQRQRGIYNNRILRLWERAISNQSKI